jgi:hypothetical protein
VEVVVTLMAVLMQLVVQEVVVIMALMVQLTLEEVVVRKTSTGVLVLLF